MVKIFNYFLMISKRHILPLAIVVSIFSYIVVVESVTRVAFVFAGSARSFVNPPVFLSIKHNLIDGFCPAPYCISEIFARVSISDNTHTGLNAVGNLALATEDKKELTKKALRRLGRSIVYELIDIGSPEEKEAMSKMVKEKPDHKIYSDLDPRRYNMYFNRWVAYQMAVEFEQKTSLKFDWIIHARLDFMWSEPLRPFSDWSSKRVWVPDSWATDIPDTFAVLPRDRAELYYSLDAMYSNDRVACLGGPDFDPTTATEIALRTRGYSSELIRKVNESLCMNRIKNEPVVVSNGVSWSWGGVSEIILRRKLRENGIDFGAKTLGFTNVPTIMVRQPLNLICHYTNIGSYIPWAQHVYHPSIIYGESCLVMNKELNRVRSIDGNSYGPSCDMHLLASKSLTSTEPMSACLIDFAVTDWNYMPFRIRGNGDECVTIHESSVELNACLDESKDSGWDVYYSYSQLFSFYPLVTTPQRIMRGENLCLSIPTSATKILSESALNRVELEVQPCSAGSHNADQLFQVTVEDYDTAVKYGMVTPLNQSDIISHRLKNADRTSVVHKHHLPDLSVAEFQWVGMDGLYCISHTGSLSLTATPLHHVGHHSVAENVHMDKLFLILCNQTTTSSGLDSEHRKHRRSKVSHYFIVERTVNRSPVNY